MKVKNLFDLKYGVNLELIRCEETIAPDGINFVARTSQNNGVVARVKLIDGIEPQKAGTLSCATSGSVLSTFVQNEPYYSGRDLYVLTPKIELTLEQKLFYAMIITRNGFRYSYGRAANKTLGEIEIPTLDVCSRIIAEKVVVPIQTKNARALQDLDMSNWREFDLTDFFKSERGTRLTIPDREDGDTPFVTAGFNNQGVIGTIQSYQKVYKDKITIDMFANVFYRDYDFSCDDNILVLTPKQPLSKFASLFITTLLNCDKFKYAYGKQYRQKDFRLHKIKLPTKVGSTPDWQFMENYVKQLPYADRI